MSDFEIIRGDIIMVTIAGLKTLMLIEAIRSAKIVRLLPGQTLADATRLLPDLSPNALNRIMLCGPVAQIGMVPLTQELADELRFNAPEVCVYLEDVEDHLPKARKEQPADGVQLK
ncbi:hypothetical protein BDE40_1894 [Litoreibacter halocynthiae]|uniref:Uncharacterized protein n=1 Tax=Litoreibacter halocynthiae TaxID=1242689 RepID=A0A4R7LHC6_9RHOB|nr:hypothetical protein [Litoreibacter halocynthiae]TDT75167.1 hypothetical protein BDE40_1894 [Litoreibacter halocynthiae]